MITEPVERVEDDLPLDDGLADEPLDRNRDTAYATGCYPSGS